MLAVATLFAAGVCWFLGLIMIHNLSSLFFWFCVRWGIGELLWCWMAADHCFTEIGRARRGGMLEEWLLTRHTPAEIANGFVYSTWMFLAVPLVAWSVLDLIFLLWKAEVTEFTLTQQIGFVVPGIVTLAYHHALSSAWASARCAAEAVQAAHPATKVWGKTLLRMAVLLLFVLFCSFAAPFIITIGRDILSLDLSEL